METQAFAALDRSMKEFDGDSEAHLFDWNLNGRIPDLGFSRQVSASLRGLRANLRRNLWSAEFKQIEVSLAKDCAKLRIRMPRPHAGSATLQYGFFTRCG